jgi:hypothetical protein
MSKIDTLIPGGITGLVGRSRAETRPYQTRIIQGALTAYLDRDLRSVMIESPTGSGKTIMSLLTARGLQDAMGTDDHGKPNLEIGWVSMRRNLLVQAENENGEGKDGKAVNAQINWLSMFEKNLPTRLLATLPGGEPNPDTAPLRMLVVDEAQHDAANTMASIHARVQPHYILGMTATPFRTDRVKLCFDTVLKDAALGSLIKDKYLSDYEHYTIPVWSVTEVCAHYLRSPERWGATIMYFHRIEECTQAALILQARGVNVEVVTASSDRYTQIERFMNGKVTVLINCMVLTEGFNAPHLQTVFCRPSCKGVTIQMCLDAETEILTKSGWRTHETISPDDLAAGFDCDTGEIEWVPIEGIVKRPVTDEETFRVIKGPHLDVRVTDQHDLVYKSRNHRGTHRDWLKATADDLYTNRGQPFMMPVAGIAPGAGLDLTDAELVLLGLYLTDGCYYRKRQQLIVAQSAESDQLPAIEAAFDNCGLQPWRGKVKRTGKLAGYAPRVSYTVGTRQLTSAVPNLKRYMEHGKAHCLELIDELTPDQLAKVLVGMQIGDGRKRRNADYIPHTYALCLGNDYEFIDKFQGLCVRKGFRCNLSYYEYPPNDWNKAGEHGAIVYIKRQSHSMVCGNTITDTMLFNGQQRTRIAGDDPVPGEVVWCIRNNLGTIVTRRNGKVAIVGNCGRAFRKHPSAPIKNIVQAKKGWPFIKLATPVGQWVWKQGKAQGKMRETGEWLSLQVNPHINALCCKMLAVLASTSTKLPDFITNSKFRTRGRGRRRRV